MKKERFWTRLDNAALIFPAVRRKNWSNAFRVSALLTEDVDPEILGWAVNRILPRFPTIAVRLRRGVFWYYLEQAPAPQVREDCAYPLVFMTKRETRTCAFRVLYYRNRVAVEFFHALTDGTGGLIFLKTLVAQYLSLRYGVSIPAEQGVLDYTEAPRPEELEDSFLRYSGARTMSRREQNSYRLTGTREPDGFHHLITGVLDTQALHSLARSYGVSVTTFLGAVMVESIVRLQRSLHPNGKQKPVKVTIPVNLRRLFGSSTLRNFVLCVNPGVDPQLGDYSLPELCRTIQAQLNAEVSPQLMSARIAANVRPAQSPILRIMPLPIKVLAMRMVYRSVGESKGCLNISNLGPTQLPEAMAPYVQRLDFVVCVQATYPNNCSVLSYGGKTCINIIRNIRQAELERLFFTRLRELGLSVTVESNGR